MCPKPNASNDEISICNCQPNDCCGDTCVNRMLLCECIQEYCPCSDRCTNNQIQKKKWKKVEVLPAGMKGI